MTLQQYVHDLVTKLCKVAGALDEGALNNVLIIGEDFLFLHALKNY